MTQAMIDAIGCSSKVVNHMHLPIQCGSDALLKKMNRGYTREHYLELIRYARQTISDLVLTTDIIVGFPGETEEMFLDTLSLLREVRFDMAYTFIYSRRTGTPAATMPNQISKEEKSRRLRRLMDVQNEISLALNRAMERKTYDVIVEGPTKNDAAHWFGRTTGNKMIIWEDDGSTAIGDTVRVVVDKGQTWVLKGHIVK
jgi:tRNA-2-methylthio-N6-dimethylallyladenosine synthase